jgi:hypothetical protein
MIVRDNFHGLLDELMALVFEALPVTVFSGIYTSSEVVVLGRRRRGPALVSKPKGRAVPESLAYHHPPGRRR